MDIEEFENLLAEIERIKKMRQDYEDKIKLTENEDEIIEYKYQMMVLKEELKPLLDIKHENMGAYNRKKEKIAKEKEEKVQKEKLYKRLYVTLDDYLLEVIKIHFNITENSRELILKELISKYKVYTINSILYIFNNLNPYRKKQLFNEVKNGNSAYVLELFDELHDSNSIKLFNEETQKTIRYIEKYGLSFNGIAGPEFFFIRDVGTYYNGDYDDYVLESDYEDLEYDLEHDSKINNDFPIYFEFDI